MKNVTPKHKAPKKVAPKPAPEKKGGFWDDDDDPEEPATPIKTEPIKTEPIVHTNLPDAPPVAAKRVREAAEIKPLPVSPPCPEGFFSLQCGEDRVLIIRPISSGDDWTDLLCYHHRMKITLHLKRADLTPKHHVDAAVEFIKSIK